MDRTAVRVREDESARIVEIVSAPAALGIKMLPQNSDSPIV